MLTKFTIDFQNQKQKFVLFKDCPDLKFATVTGLSQVNIENYYLFFKSSVVEICSLLLMFLLLGAARCTIEKFTNSVRESKR